MYIFFRKFRAPDYVTAKDIGLIFQTNYVLKVIDEKLFFLAVIKYGIEYEEIKV